ncbi:tyrosine-type recombinase/integrase [Methanoculleus sp.]|uniref:tyrosine-type recombinase/integrase n=1 Tax=Methanoculleus sp. TaxID=90427 RepID=UPI001BD6D958|nr:tyrosine-type recombinase/integrase [Methanoculleus sp.]
MDEKNPERRRTRDVSKFIKNRPKATAATYQSGLVKFLDFVFDNKKTRRIAPPGRAPVDVAFYDKLAIEYLNGDRDEFDFADDLQDFIRANAGAAPKSLGIYKSTVLSWLAENHIYLHQQTTRRIQAGGRPLTRDRIPTHEELRKILGHGDLQLKAYILLLSSSGLRPSEGLKLRWDDIDREHGLIRVRGEIAKNKTPRITFISVEAMETLNEWREYFDQYITKIDAVTWREIERDTDRVFPVTYKATREKFLRVLEKAGLDETDPSTGRTVLHLHALRKFYRTRLAMGGVPVDVVEELMGHEGYLAGSYVRLTVADLEVQYRAAEHELWIYRTKPINEEQLRRVEADYRDLQEKYDQVQQQIAKMDAIHSLVAAHPEALQALIDKRIKEALESAGK